MKIFSGYSLFLPLAGLATFLQVSGCQDPTFSEVLYLLESAKHTIGEAKQGGAMTFAPELLSLAESELVTGEKELHTQEDNFFWARDFSLALHLVSLAQLDAEKALSLTESKKQQIRPSDLRVPPNRDSPQETLL